MPTAYLNDRTDLAVPDRTAEALSRAEHQLEWLRAALDRLVTKWRADSEREHRQGNDRDHILAAQSYLYGCDQTHDVCADELLTVLLASRTAD